MKISHRRSVLTSTASVAVLALGLTACSSGRSGSGDADGVVLYTWAAGSESQWDTFVEAAQSQLDGIPLSYEGPSFADYFTQIKTRYSGGDAPCLVATQGDKIGSMASLLAPLDDQLEAAGVSTADFNPAMIDGMTVDGEVKALPYDSSALVLYYNKALFAQYGVAEPSASFTTDEFEAAAAALTADGNTGFAYAGSWFFFGPFAIAAGETWSDGDGGLNLTDPGLADTLQSYFDLAADGYATPLTAGETATQQDAFGQGDVGMIVGGTWDYSSLVEALGEGNVGVAPIPSPQGDGPQFVSGSGYGIAASCAGDEDAFAALTALTSVETMQAAAEAIGTVPARTEVLDEYLSTQDADYATTVSAILANGKVAPYVENWANADTLLTQYLPEGFSGAMSAAEILEQVQSSVGE